MGHEGEGQRLGGSTVWGTKVRAAAGWEHSVGHEGEGQRLGGSTVWGSEVRGSGSAAGWKLGGHMEG